MPEALAPAGSCVATAPRTGARIAVVILAAVVACVSIAGMFLIASPPAAAHDQLLASDPADGDEFDTMPDAVTLTFSDEPLETGAEVVLTDGDGATVALQDITVDGSALSASLPSTLPGGEYHVAWHIVSGDGHPLEGAFSFTVDGPDAPEPTRSPEGAGSTQETAEPTTAAPDAAVDTPAGADAESGAAAPGTPAGLSSGAAWIAVLAAASLVVTLLVVMRRRMQEDNSMRRRDDGGARPDTIEDGEFDGERDQPDVGDAGGSGGGDSGGSGGGDGGGGGGD
ncbi:copper resistance CopC family protein [Myceligenerans indicum]|uniref:Copper resistance protein CopC n=1 Tax=Myceligenerans indicum TaxID=2593663 RepID=A0ABS1LNI8_9MICO|nr:copper resistance protein CopC [Myceligenerans indicum]MBL0887795.1 copper resistance protein CopC [Myceligenerans indicum]